MSAPRPVLTVILTIGLLGPPLTVEAQTGTVPRRIGLLDSGSLAGRASLWEAFRQGMRELGYVEGRTVTFEARGADGDLDRLTMLAAELVRLKVDVMVVGASSAAWKAREATAAIPIVMASGNPLEGGYVASLARPGGNVTGLTSASVPLGAKRLELVIPYVPGLSPVRGAAIRPLLVSVGLIVVLRFRPSGLVPERLPRIPIPEAPGQV